MSLSRQSPRKKSLCHHHGCCCSFQSPTGGKYIIVIFIFLFGITFPIVVSPFHFYFISLVYFLSYLFPPCPPYNNAAAEAYQQIPIPLIPLLNNDGLIYPYFILHNLLYLIQGYDLPPHDFLTTSLPYYPVWRHGLKPQLQWGQQ